MKNNTLSFLFVVILLLGGKPLCAQTNHLKKQVTVQLDNIELQDALPKIGEAGDFQFSYNAEIIPGDSIISVEADNQNVEELLTALLGSGIRYKVLGNHIILLENNRGKRPPKEKDPIEYFIMGYIYDGSSGDILASASVYEVEGMVVASTDAQGYYRITLPGNRKKQVLSFSKTGYLDTLIVVTPKEDPQLNIYLRPKPVAVVQPEPEIPGDAPIPSHTPGNIDERKMVAVLVPAQTMIAAENIPVIEERFIQVSLLPWIGSNRFVSGLITNNLSLNILAGYAGGLNGFELGGFMNIDRKNVKGVQIGGFGNIVGKNTNGVQLAGFFNANVGSFTGVQMAGFSNLVMDTIRGVQIAGFLNALHGPMYGPQISGFANFTSKNVDGMQISGFANVALKDVLLAQISGFANYSRSVGGAQISGFANIATGTSRGGQISGFFNYAKELKGFQIGVINVADTVSFGAPVGFVSFVRKGYHPLEVSANELFPINLTFKTGVNLLYNIFTAGWSNDLFTAGYGLGTRFRFGDKVGWNTDITAQYVGRNKNPEQIGGGMIRLATALDFRIFKFLSVYAGPQVSSYGALSSIGTPPYQLPLMFSQDLYTQQWGDFQLKVWLGATVGLRFM